MRHRPIRRTAGIVTVGLLLAALIVGSAAGDPGSVYTIRAGGDLDWVPGNGGFGPSTSSSPTSTSGTLSDQNGSADYSVAAGPGIVRGSIAGSFSTPGRFNPSVRADASSDLTLVGPTGYVAIPVSLNLHVDSTFKVEQCPDLCNISIGVQGYGGTTRFSMGAGFTENGLGLTADPVPGGFHLHGDVATPQFGLTPNLPAPVGISLQINVNNLNRGYSGSSVFTVGPSVVSFAPSGPVVNGVPAEYTVSGPGVDDNHWTDPFVPDIELRHTDGTPVGSGETLDLGTTPSGTTSAPGYFRIFNAGTANLHVSGVNPPSSFQVQGGGGGEITPGSDQEVGVTCNATNTTANPLTVEGNITVQSDDPDESTVLLHVQCTVLPGPPPGAPDIELRFADGTPMPATNPVVDIGDVPSGAVRPGAYRIANVGESTLEVTDITHDTPAVGVAIAPSLSASISPGGNSPAQLGCGGTNPDTTPRDVEFTVAVHSNDPDEGTAEFTVRCRLLPAPIILPPANPPDIDLRFDDGTPMANPSVLDLGDVAYETRKSQDFEIGNTGDATLVISDYLVDPSPNAEIRPFTIDTTTVLAHGRTPAHIVCDNGFSNNGNGGGTPKVLTVTLTIVSNDPDESPIGLTVRCTLLPRPEPIVELRFDDGTPMPANTTIDLGDVDSGSTKFANFRVANIGKR